MLRVTGQQEEIHPGGQSVHSLSPPNHNPLWGIRKGSVIYTPCTTLSELFKLEPTESVCIWSSHCLSDILMKMTFGLVCSHSLKMLVPLTNEQCPSHRK